MGTTNAESYAEVIETQSAGAFQTVRILAGEDGELAERETNIIELIEAERKKHDDERLRKIEQILKSDLDGLHGLLAQIYQETAAFLESEKTREKELEYARFMAQEISDEDELRKMTDELIEVIEGEEEHAKDIRAKAEYKHLEFLRQKLITLDMALEEIEKHSQKLADIYQNHQ